MRKFIALFLVFLLSAGIYYQRVEAKSLLNKYLYFSVCDQPLGYSIGELDQRFGYSKDQLKTIAEEAGGLWNKAYGKNLLAYDPQAKLSVNLIFDERQSRLNTVESLKNEVDQNKGKLTPSLTEFERLRAEFMKKQDDLNEKIRDWNSKGGAPEEEFNKLIKSQEELKTEYDKLTQMAKSLNQSTAEYNAKVQTLNKAAQSFNSTINEKPEGGIYNPNENRIEAYYGSDKKELIRILTHEMGHALDLGHSADAKDIMYFEFSEKESSISKEDINALAQICKPRNKLIIMKADLTERLRLLKKLYLSKYMR